MDKLLANPEFWKTVPSFLWLAFAVLLFLVFRGELRGLLRHFSWRIRSGAAVKIASFEISAPYVQQNSEIREVKGIDEIREDTTRDFHNSREPFRSTYRNLFLVHRLAPSRDDEQLYDVLIYVVPSLKHGSLEGVKTVEYYFGLYWGRSVFKKSDRASGFAIATSAWAPFTCTAKVTFTDGQSVFLHRFVDFEMGPIGNVPMSPKGP